MVALRCYLLASGADAIREWYAAQPAQVRGAVFAVLEALQATPRSRWRRKRFALLGKRGQSECRGLGEIRIEVQRVHYRIFGYFDEEGNTFTMVFAFRKDWNPAYDRACPIAQRRKSNVLDNVRRADECTISTY